MVPLREELEWAELLARPRDGRGPRASTSSTCAPSTSATRRSATTSSSWRSAPSRASCPFPASPSTRWASRRCPTRSRPQPRAAQPGDRRVAAGRRQPARVPHLRVRRGGLRGRRGLRGAAGLREDIIDATRAAASRARAGCWSRPRTASCARSPRASRRSPRASSAGAAWRSARAHARAHGRAERRAVDRRAPAHAAVCWTAGVRTPGIVKQLGLPLTPATASRPTPRCG